ncbi:hypothetical protein [Limnobacter parvus]|uniref:SH3 domain-containing protein n=1 Tax=Limnobacter parvus TaxID=2939690 RepID=A0ABT1XCR4_9BURK|nr:hypothetical protein [Limnobacter parvus]MCR2745075.1 hypothetical protein [Limnobacter parvus]
MKKLNDTRWLLVLLTSTLPAVGLAQTIANPLVRPALLTETNNAAEGSAPAKSTAPVGNSADSEDLRQQAERRITQEDLNVRQQALNSAVVPLALANLFSGMQVTAHIQNAIVMRKVSNETVQTSPGVGTSPGQGGQAGQGGQESVVAGTRNVSRSTAVVRLRVGQVVNISGYSVRAKVMGQDVMVDWLSDKGAWVNVFFGALESSDGGIAQVPTDSQLLKVETESFNYLVPRLNTQTFSATGVAGNQQSNQQGNNGNFGSGFGGGNQGFGQQPGFGSSSPF